MENKKLAGRVYIFLDITDKQQMIDELNYLVDHDWLTNVYNRRKILEETERLLSASSGSGQDSSLLMLV